MVSQVVTMVLLSNYYDILGGHKGGCCGIPGGCYSVSRWLLGGFPVWLLGVA